MTSPASSDTYEILALKYAEYTQRKRFESFIGADDHDQPHPIDYFVWVIRNAQRTIVVDTGFDAIEGAKRGRRVIRAPAAALEQIGVAAPARSTRSSSPTCTTTMPARSSAFPKARFHLQAAEMAYATGPCMCHAFLRHPFTVDHVCEMVKNVYSGRVVFHDGDAEIAPGVTVHKIGGHSRGLQCVRVATANGPVVLASDASHFYENFEKGKVFPVTIDIADVLAGYQRHRGAGRLPPPRRPRPRPAGAAALPRTQQRDGGHRAPARCGAAGRVSGGQTLRV